MLTEFGRALRKLRLDCNEVLKDMALRLGYTSSYMSAIELGRRTIPSDLIDRLTELYDLTDDAVQNLERAKAQSLKKVTLNLGDASLQKVEAALSLARSFPDLDEQTAMTIRNFLRQSMGKE